MSGLMTSLAAPAVLSQGKGEPVTPAPEIIKQRAAQSGDAKVTVNPDGRMVISSPDGHTTISYPDGRVVNVAPDGSMEESSPSGPFQGDPGVPDGAVVAMVSLSSLGAFLLGRWLTGRAFRRRVKEEGGYGRGLAPDLGERIDRIEHAVESVAIEVERISEGQRFTTKLMSEMRPAAAAQLPGAQPEPTPAARHDPVATVPAGDRRS